jgi:uncharacterized protein
MELIGQQRIAAPIDKTWVALNDPGVLKECIAGCESIERVSEREYAVAMAVKIGPVNAKFKGKLFLDNLQPPNSYTINFEGQGGVAGFGKGSADVKLTPEGPATLLDYAARAQVGGKIAQIGSRLVDMAAKKMADDFFVAFNTKVAGSQAAIEMAAGESAAGVSAPGELTARDGVHSSAQPAPTAVKPTAVAVSDHNKGLPAWIWLAAAAVVVLAIIAFGGK